MAPNRRRRRPPPPPVEDPSPDSSAGEEEEVETSSSEDEQSQPQINTQMTTPKKSQPPTQQSNSDSESESESDSDNENDRSVKRSTSKSLKETTTTPKKAAATKKHRSAATKEKSTAGAKRSNGAVDYSKKVKRAKIKESESQENGSKRTPFERLWSDDDEVALLEGMVNFVEVNGGFEPRKDMNALFNSVEKSIQFDVTLPKFGDKLRRLRRKFERNVKAKKEGKVFEESHDQKIFDLSNSIWGSEGIIKAKGKRNDNRNDRGRGDKRGKVPKKLEPLRAEEGVHLGGKDPMEVERDRKLTAKKVLKCDGFVSVGKMSEMGDFLDRNWVNFTPSERKKVEMENAELELFLKHNEFMQEKVKLVLEGLRADKD